MQSFSNIVNKIKNGDKDSKIVLANIAGAFTIKGLAMFISLWTVPAFLSYFDDNTYLGIWYTVLSVIMWFLTFDFGIGNGVRNRLVKTFINKDILQSKRIISSGIFIALGCSVGLFVMVLPLLYFIDWNSVFGISAKTISNQLLREVSIWLYLTILIRFVLVTISSIFYALQLSSINNLLAFLSSCLIFLFVKFTHFSSPEVAIKNVAIAYAILYNLPILIGAIILFATKLRKCIPDVKYIDKVTIKDIFSLGGRFFYCQILFTILTCSDQFLITKFYGVDYTVDYTFYHRLTSILSMIIALGTTPLWSMITKAMEQNKYRWILSLFMKLKWVAISVIILELLFIPCLQPVMNIWLGSRTIEVNYLIAISFALFGSLFILNNLFSTFACGLGKLKVQVIWYTIGCVLKFMIIICLNKKICDWSLVIWADVIAFMPYVLIQFVELKKFFREKIQ